MSPLSEGAISSNERYRQRVREQRLVSLDPGFAELAGPVLASPHYDKIRKIPHHGDSVADHSVAVAFHTYRAARFLGLRSHLPELIRGALLHDFFHYNWRETRPRSGGLHGFDHPKEACENAEAAFGPLTSIERDCILRHMWPLTPLPPHFPESLIVCFTDKAVALLESWRSLKAGGGLGVL